MDQLPGSRYPELQREAIARDVHIRRILLDSDAWAVGGTSWWNGSQTLAEHWNGTSWTPVATPAQTSAVFNGVAATSGSNAWAVGSIGPGPGVQTSAYVPLIEQWNGSTWSPQSFQPVPGRQPVQSRGSGFPG